MDTVGDPYIQPPPSAGHSKGFKIFLIVTGTTVSVVILGMLALASYAKMYEGKVYPGIKISEYELGGMTPDALKSFIENIDNRYSKEGLVIEAKDTKGEMHKVVFNTVVDSDTGEEIIRLDSDALVREVMSVGRGPNPWANAVLPLWYRFFAPHVVRAPLITNDTQILGELKTTLGGFEDSPQNATIIFDKGAPARAEAEKSGLIYNYTALLVRIQNTFKELSFAPIQVSPEMFVPTISKADLELALPHLNSVLADGEMSFNYIDSKTQARHDWNVTPYMLTQWVEPRRDDDGKIIFALNKQKVLNYLEQEVASYINTPAAEAKFTMEGNKVQEFTASRTGLALNEEKTYADLDAAFRARNYETASPIKTIGVSVDIVEPTVKTADVNNMGITDIIGVGVSSFRGSHPARIKNVARAVHLLNGVLIKPGEIFSTAKYVGPITEENGYLPELVIKGDDASQKEVGGGMCQIGTTLFRMSMNSGMPITERRNHSLVVNYYADPVNGNPGTDATIYDPLVDFKFLNDTGNYLLLQTDMNMKTVQLTFTLWGKPDGRKGSYTHPLVSKWIPTGPAKNIPVTDGTLKPGEKRCQPAYKGAVASFTYTRFTSSSEKIDQVFTSYYRPLPATCRVGVEPDNPCLVDNSCFAVPSSTPGV